MTKKITKKSQELCKIEKGKIKTWKIQIEFSKYSNIVYLSEFEGEMDKKKTQHMETVVLGKCFDRGDIWEVAKKEFYKRIGDKNANGFY